MKARQKRILLVALGVAGVALASALIVTSLRGNLNYYFTPEKVIAGEAPADQRFRLGGMVREGSLKRDDQGLGVEFVLTDYKKDVTVRYEGILPDLFKEQQAAVVKGELDATSGKFIAMEVLAKHDESYMPPEVTDSIDKSKLEEMKQKMPSNPMGKYTGEALK